MSPAIPKEFVAELKSSGITEAVIVDDLFETASLAIVTDLPGFWTEFLESRALHPALETIFSGVVNEDEVEDRHIEGCWNVLSNGISTDILNRLFGDYAQRKSELNKLSTLLSEIFGTPTIELVPSATIPDEAKLVFLDYYLGDDTEAANTIAKKLAKRKHLRPYLVLISDSANLRERSEGFRSDTGYIAGTFAHLEKEKAIDPAELAYSLASWGLGNSALRVIQPLFDAMIASVDEAAKAVKNAMAAVTIQDYSFLQNLSLAGDGHPLGEYIVDLFGASLSYRFRDSPEIKEARALADKTPFKKHLPLSMVPSHLIFELYREVLTEPLVEEKIVEHPWCSEKTISVIEEAPESTAPTFAGCEAPSEPVQPQATECVSAINVTAKEFIDPALQAPSTEQSALDQRDKAGPAQIAVPEVAIPPLPEKDAPKVFPSDENAIAWLSTGDIFAKDEKEPLLMVLNAGCDLQFAPNSKRKPQHDRSILLIEGTVYQINNLQPPDEIARTEFFRLGETLCRINWTDRVRTIKHVDFKSTMEKDGYEKRVARLSLPYVLQVQQAWLASLGRVGVPVAPPHSGSSDIEIYVTLEKVPVLRTRVSHGATVFRVKQNEGYVSEFLLSKDTVTAVRQALQELIKLLLEKGGAKPEKKAEELGICLQTFDFWRELQEKPRAFTKGTLSIKNGILKASFNEVVAVSDVTDTQIVLRFAEPQAVGVP